MYTARRPLPLPLSALDLPALADSLQRVPHTSDLGRAVMLADAVRTAACEQREMRLRRHKRK